MIANIDNNIRELKALINSPDLTAKLALVEELAQNCYYLSAMVADAHEAMLTSEFLYKSAVTGEVAVATGGVSKAEAKAKHQYKSLYENMIRADAAYTRYNLLLRAANTVIDQTRQSISYLKIEYSNTIRS